MQLNNIKKRILELYFSNIFIYAIALFLFHTLPFYTNYLSSAAQQTIFYFFFGFILLSPFYYLKYVKEDTTNKSFTFICAIKESIIQRLHHKKNYSWTKEEKISALFLLVKLFYLPLMINFAHNNISDLKNILANFEWYPLTLLFIFTLDTLIFAFGYVFEAPLLQNVVKSVEPTLFGWFVTLICYPPFNSIVGTYIPWGANDYAVFENAHLTLVLHITVIVLLTIYVLASVALGTKASNLTNRGIVTKFPYSIVRHPAYISKNLAWWLTLIPVINWQFSLGMAVWSLIYFFRAITEEKHLSQDLEYKEYCKKVKYKFIPGII